MRPEHIDWNPAASVQPYRLDGDIRTRTPEQAELPGCAAVDALADTIPAPEWHAEPAVAVPTDSMSET